MRREARAREAGGARNRSMWITRALPLEIRANARSTGWDICIVFICVVYTRERARSDVDGGATGGTTRDERPHRGRPNHTLTHGTLVYERRANQKRGRQTTSRVALRPPSASANDQLACDVCQMNPAYVICHEDRAFLCRVCDVSIHDANSQSKSHQRFLFGNTRVDLEAMGAGEEVGRRVRSPSDSAAEHARVPDFEEEETGRQPKVRTKAAFCALSTGRALSHFILEISKLTKYLTSTRRDRTENTREPSRMVPYRPWMKWRRACLKTS